MKRLLLCGVACFALTVEASAQNLLLDGGLEVPTAQFASWETQEFITGTGAPTDSLTRQNFANRNGEVAGEFGAWFRPWIAGSMSTDKANAVISQTVPGTAGLSYTLTGWSKFETNYSGGVDFLDVLSPLDPGMTGEVPSPTETLFELAFLDSSNSVLGAPVVLDLRTARGSNPNNNAWIQHTLMGTAPSGTANVRVTASMLDGVFNTNPMQSAFVDDFSLTASAAPGTELLANPNLNETPPEFPESWTLVETPSGRDTAGGAGFANREAPGQNGLWLKAFSGTLADPSDAIFSQTLSATPGGDYTFSAWSKWEANYSGGLAVVSGSPSPTQTLIELAFLDASENVIGTPEVLDLKTAGQLNDNTWREFSVDGVAPANAVSVRVSAVMNDGVSSGLNPQSAFFDDFSLTLAGAPAEDADFDNDGDVDGRDLLIWQRNLGTGNSNTTGDADGNGMVNAADLTIWRQTFGAGAATPNVGAVPEPATAMIGLAAMALVAMMGRRRCG